MAKHRKDQAPRGDQPMTGTGRKGSGIKPKGVVYRSASGQPSGSKAGTTSRLFGWLNRKDQMGK